VPSVAMIAVFSAIAAPLIIATTETAGHVTFGDTGAITMPGMYVVSLRFLSIRPCRRDI